MTFQIAIPEWYVDRPFARGQYEAIARWAAIEHPFYRKHAPDPSLVFPVLTRAVVQADNELLLNGHPETERTSGATSTPVRVSWSPQRARREKLDAARMLGWLGGSMPVLRIVSTQVHAPSERTFDISRPVEEQLEFIRERHAIDGTSSIVTYPTNLELLCRHIIAQDLDFSFVRRVTCLSEVFEPEHDRLIGQAFPNAYANVTYSSVEVGLIAARCPHRPDNYHVMADKLGVEILDEDDRPCAPGELGRVVVTDYRNRWSTLIRYAQGDLAAPVKCDCGRIPLPAITNIVGKVQGVFRTREGRRIIFTYFSPTFRDSPEIGQYQVVQESLDRFTVRCVPRAGADLAPFKARIQAKFEAEFGQGIRIAYETMEHIPRGPGGKFLVAICRLQD
ncbi:hypothetical protein [Arenimonas sp.]|uniref:hypothetical protein n=1 Tax=Arenimonas sp. TaxID=1872635 RepID=UPI0039E5B0B6